MKNTQSRRDDSSRQSDNLSSKTRALSDQEYLSPERSTTTRPKANPTVTPKRFRRFFTPRSFQASSRSTTVLGSLDVSQVSNHQLPTPDTTSQAGHCASAPEPHAPSSPIERLVGDGTSRGTKRKISSTTRQQAVAKRRGHTENEEPVSRLALPPRSSLASHTASTTSLLDSPSAPLIDYFSSRSIKHQEGYSKAVPTASSTLPATPNPSTPQPIRRMTQTLPVQLLDRLHGFSLLPGLSHIHTPTCDFRHLTAKFYSGSYDSATLYDVQAPTEPVLPFCLASSERVAITAVGDERGNIHYLRTTSPRANLDVTSSNIVRSVNAHNNAIFDLSLSHDDRLLATGSGNRSICVQDTESGRVIHTINEHKDSLRQVKFQPGSTNMLASSDKGGTIQIWDLRCAPKPAVNTLEFAHRRPGQTSPEHSPASVTSLCWMNAHREHLLLSASDASTCIRLWDTRYLQSPSRTRRAHTPAVPLSSTAEPLSHSSRHYGVTTIVSNTEGSRLYAVSKDNHVYAYSTEHLIRGVAPELAEHDDARRKPIKRRPCDHAGLGPLYAMRHQDMCVGSFYVKGAVRKLSSRHKLAELLAVGSSKGKAILFPTDERYLRGTQQGSDPSSIGFYPSPAPMPVYNCGTSLVRGHSEREVTAISWARDGQLVTGGDDRVVRQWQEDDGEKARSLRTAGEFGGVRFNSGWAEVEEDWDEDDW